MLSSTSAADRRPSPTSRGVIERIPPIPRQKNDAEKNASTKHAQVCGCGTAAFTSRPTPVAAMPRQRHKRNELDERQRRDGKRRVRELVDLEQQGDLHDAGADVLRGLTEPEPAERRRLPQRREVDREPREALAHARAFEPRRDILGETRIVAQKS